MKTFLAVTGGIGSGKSYVVKIFSALGIPVYDADSRTKELYDENAVLLSSLVALLGKNLVRNGRLDRTYMAERIFGDPELLRKVESIVFPHVLEDIGHWRETHESSPAPFLLMESAIYLEKEAFRGVADKVLTVSSPQDVRIARVMFRNKVSREFVEARIRNQSSDAFRESRSDYVIVSDFSHPLLPQVLDVCSKIKAL